MDFSSISFHSLSNESYIKSFVNLTDDKYFTYVTKTLLHLSTLRGRPGNWFGTTIFVIGFVKTSLQSIKDLCQLDFFTKSLTFCFVLIYWLCWAESTASTAALQQKRSDILVVLWQKCQIFKVNYLWLKKFDTKINAILLISELMASVRKVLRHFHRHGEIFT